MLRSRFIERSFREETGVVGVAGVCPSRPKHGHARQAFLRLRVQATPSAMTSTPITVKAMVPMPPVPGRIAPDLFWTMGDTVRCGLVVAVAIVVVVGDGDGGIRGVSAVVLAINLHADGAGELVVAGRRFGLGQRVLAVLQSPEDNLTACRSGDSRRSICLTSLSYTVYSVRGRTTGIDLHEAHSGARS